jgi:hypothetical protein
MVKKILIPRANMPRGCAHTVKQMNFKNFDKSPQPTFVSRSSSCPLSPSPLVCHVSATAPWPDIRLLNKFSHPLCLKYFLVCDLKMLEYTVPNCLYCLISRIDHWCNPSCCWHLGQGEPGKLFFPLK